MPFQILTGQAIFHSHSLSDHAAECVDGIDRLRHLKDFPPFLRSDYFKTLTTVPEEGHQPDVIEMRMEYQQFPDPCFIDSECVQLSLDCLRQVAHPPADD